MRQQKVLYWSVTVALAGFLFGFDTIVISGADQALQALWPKGELYHGFVIMASALWGTVIGAMFGNLPTERIGRKRTLIWIGVLYFVSAVGSAWADDPNVFSLFRFIGGLGVGASTIAAPAFISEIAPARDRGRLVMFYQSSLVTGILVAFLSNYLLSLAIEHQAWRWMLGVEGIPALLYTLLVLNIPESPRWLLVRRNDRTAAARILAQVDPSADIEAEMDRILADRPDAARRETIFSPAYRFPLMLAFLVAFFNQFSGINAFLYYAPRIFQEAGLAERAALLSSAGIGITNLVFTLTGLLLIDRVGRRRLMYIGSVGYIVSLALVAMAFRYGWQGMAVPIFLFIFIASHAIGQGSIIWVFISEIFPNHLRADGQAFGSSVHWVLAAIIPASIPFLFKLVGPAPVFAFFSLMMVLQLVFTWRMMPETKGRSLEELERLLVRGRRL